MTQYDRLPALIVMVSLLCCGTIGSLLWARFGCACRMWRCRGCHVFGSSSRNRTPHTTRRTLDALAGRLLLTPTAADTPESQTQTTPEDEAASRRLPDVPQV